MHPRPLMCPTFTLGALPTGEAVPWLVISEGPPQVVAKDPTVIDSYLGAHHDDKSEFERGPAERRRRSLEGAPT